MARFPEEQFVESENFPVTNCFIRIVHFFFFFFFFLLSNLFVSVFFFFFVVGVRSTSVCQQPTASSFDFTLCFSFRLRSWVVDEATRRPPHVLPRGDLVSTHYARTTSIDNSSRMLPFF
jgi:hypothetical protein